MRVGCFRYFVSSGHLIKVKRLRFMSKSNISGNIIHLIGQLVNIADEYGIKR